MSCSQLVFYVCGIYMGPNLPVLISGAEFTTDFFLPVHFGWNLQASTRTVRVFFFCIFIVPFKISSLQPSAIVEFARRVIYHREQRETRNLSSVSNYRSRTVIGSLAQSRIGPNILCTHAHNVHTYAQ